MNDAKTITNAATDAAMGPAPDGQGTDGAQGEPA